MCATKANSSQPAAVALPAGQLRRTCRPEELGFADTDALEPIAALIGQERALDAMHFAANMRKPGFNVFALGAPGSGRHTAIRSFLEEKAAEEAVADDWVYVNNFKLPHQPTALRLPPGTALRLRDAMDLLIDDLATAIPMIFETDDYRRRKGAIDKDTETAQEALLTELRQKAEARNIGIIRTQAGFSVAPIQDGQLIKPEMFNALPEENRREIEMSMQAMQAELEKTVRQLPALEKRRRDEMRALHAEMVSVVVDSSLHEISNGFADIAAVRQHLDYVRQDLVDSAGQFLQPPGAMDQGPMPPASARPHSDPRFRRYGINVMVANPAPGDGDSQAADTDRYRTHSGAPVIAEEYPTLANLVGRIEHMPQMGALVTDFSLIKPGALHRANGGYLVLDARRVLVEPFAWEALKRCLRSGAIQITSGDGLFGPMATTSLDPDPIPLAVKVVLIGDRALYYMLANLEPDFPDLFKVQADFDDSAERTAAMINSYARLIGTMAKREGLKPLTAAAVARVIDEVTRMAEDSERLSLRVGPVADLLREADYWAGEQGRKTVADSDIEQALKAQRHRADRIQKRSLEQITRGTVLIDTDGVAVGQINGLSVLSLGQVSFGRPTRITARVRMGTGKLVDIEREVDLGGPLHSKGVLILSSYLSAHYALDQPMSLWASLVFEQSYGGVDGDSASSAELYALLSALADMPIRQDLAVTGSVNQRGEVQAIGGVNEKIEGFFEICKVRGLTGRQGVLIPQTNVKNLILHQEVVDAAAAGRFHIYPIATIDQGIALLTGEDAADVDKAVEAKLQAFARTRRQAFNTNVQ